MVPPAVNITQMERAPLPAPSTSRSLASRLSSPSTRATTRRTRPPVPPSHSQSSSLSPPPPDTDQRSDLGIRIKGSASRKTRHANPSVTVHLAPAAAEPTGSDLANLDQSPDPVSAAGPAPATGKQAPNQPTTPAKRKTPPADSDLDDQGPLLSEYMCPICFSPPKSAIITPCGHILCGSCLHGAITARPVGSQDLCPVCRTPIPNLNFTMPPPATGTPAPQPPPRPRTRRHVPPASRNLPGGFSLPTRGEDMVDPDALEGTIDVDVSDDERSQSPQPEEETWDPARSGVIGLEILTLGDL